MKFEAMTVRDPPLAARDFAADERTKGTGILCVFGGFGSVHMGQKIRLRAARDFGTDERTKGTDILCVFGGFGSAHMGQKIRCR